ncbi:MAG: type II toxin-antitoxin system VapC family toxin [Dehalococcoidia bacterium]
MLLDTSFVVEALIPTQRHHEPSRRFLEDLAVGGTTVVFSRLLEVELAEASFRIGLKELHRRDWATARLDGRSRRRGRARMLAVLAAWEATLAALDWARIEVQEVVSRVRDLMGSYGLSSYDAVHAATALDTGIHDLVTLDSGFAALPPRSMRLLVDSSRVRRCRQIRSGP